MPLVSVVMSAYKEDPSIFRDAVNSILAQTFTDYEFLIVLDNPDNDELKSIIDAYAQEDQRIRPIFNERNLGLAASLNKALKVARGLYICRMDADDIAYMDRIARQLECLTEQAVDLVGGDMEVIDGFGNILYSVNYLPETSSKIKNSLRWNNCVPHPTWFGKCDIFKSGYREIPLCEDYDFLLRASLSGKKFANTKGPVLKYRMSDASISRSNLFDQYLYMRYLTSSYAQGKVADIEAATSWVASQSSQSKRVRYLKANESFNSAMGRIEAHDYLKAFVYLLRIAFTSPSYVKKMFRLVFAALSL